MNLPVEDGKPAPSFEWFFVSEVIEAGVTADQLLRLWEQGRIRMWMTTPAGVYSLPDGSQIFHIESLGPLQISAEALPDFANYGEAVVRRVATPPKYDDQWRVIDSGQFFELPAMRPIKFERLRIRHDDFADIVLLDEMAKAEEHAQPTVTEPPSETESKRRRGRPSVAPKYAQPQADRVACDLYDRTQNEKPTGAQICKALSKAHGGSPLTWKNRFDVFNCHNAIKRWKELKEQK